MKHPEIPLFLNNGELVGSRKILRQLCSLSVHLWTKAVSRLVTKFIQSSTFYPTNVSVSAPPTSRIHRRPLENSEKMELKKADSCVQHGGVKTLCPFSGWRPFNEKNLISFMNGRKRF